MTWFAWLLFAFVVLIFVWSYIGPPIMRTIRARRRRQSRGW